MTALTAGDKASIKRFLNILTYTAETRKVDRLTGDEQPHTMPLRQLMALLEIAIKEGQLMNSYEMAGDSKSSRSKNLRALTNRGARERQNGFNFVYFQESLDDSRNKEVYLTDKGKEFIDGLAGMLKEFNNDNTHK